MIRSGVVLAAIVCVFAVVDRATAQSRDELTDLAQRAASAYSAGVELAERDADEAERLFRSSIDLHHELLDRPGFDNGYIHYNIGNAHQRLGDRGRAIAAYRRAERTLGDWPGLQANLAFARGGVGAPSPQQQLWIVRALRVHERISPGVRLWAALLVAGAGWLVLAARVGGASRAPWGAGVALLLVSMVPAGSLAVQAVTAPPPAAVVIADEVVARLGPSETGYEPAFNAPLTDGIELRVLERRGDWLLAQLDSGGSGWLPVGTVEFVELAREPEADLVAP